LYALVDDFDAFRAPVRTLVEEALKAGPPAAVERFWGYLAGNDGWFGVELGTCALYLPGTQALAALSAPVRLLASEAGLSVFAEIAGRLSKRLGVDVTATPGTPVTYHEHPQELAAHIRLFLREVGG
jgi:hypothetical protein